MSGIRKFRKVIRNIKGPLRRRRRALFGRKPHKELHANTTDMEEKSNNDVIADEIIPLKCSYNRLYLLFLNQTESIKNITTSAQLLNVSKQESNPILIQGVVKFPLSYPVCSVSEKQSKLLATAKRGEVISFQIPLEISVDLCFEAKAVVEYINESGRPYSQMLFGKTFISNILQLSQGEKLFIDMIDRTKNEMENTNIDNLPVCKYICITMITQPSKCVLHSINSVGSKNNLRKKENSKLFFSIFEYFVVLFVLIANVVMFNIVSSDSHALKIVCGLIISCVIITIICAYTKKKKNSHSHNHSENKLPAIHTSYSGTNDGNCLDNMNISYTEMVVALSLHSDKTHIFGTNNTTNNKIDNADWLPSLLESSAEITPDETTKLKIIRKSILKEFCSLPVVNNDTSNAILPVVNDDTSNTISNLSSDPSLSSRNQLDGTNSRFINKTIQNKSYDMHWQIHHLDTYTVDEFSKRIAQKCGVIPKMLQNNNSSKGDDNYKYPKNWRLTCDCPQRQMNVAKYQDCWNTWKQCRWPFVHEIAGNGKRGDQRLVAFLRARNGDVDKTIKMVFDSIRWRQKFDLSRVRRMKQPTYVWKPSISLEKWMLPLPIFTSLDVEGHVLFYSNYGKLDVNGFLNKCLHSSEEELEKIFVFILETFQSAAMKRCAMSDGKILPQISLLVDLRDFGFHSVIPLGIIKRLLDSFQKNYPELLARVIVVNAPWLFANLWKVIRKFLDERVRQKIIISNNTGLTLFEEVSAWIHPRFIPKFIFEKHIDTLEKHKCNWLKNVGEGLNTLQLAQGGKIPKCDTTRFDAENEYASSHINNDTISCAKL